MMRSISGDKGVDIILDLLKQSQAIRTNLVENENNDVLETKEVEEDISSNPRTSLRRTDTDKDIMLSRKERLINQRKNEEDYNKSKSMIEGILNPLTAKDYRRES